jgi:hypothetical protein
MYDLKINLKITKLIFVEKLCHRKHEPIPAQGGSLNEKIFFKSLSL